MRTTLFVKSFIARQCRNYFGIVSFALLAGNTIAQNQPTLPQNLSKPQTVLTTPQIQSSVMSGSTPMQNGLRHPVVPAYIAANAPELTNIFVMQFNIPLKPHVLFELLKFCVSVLLSRFAKVAYCIIRCGSHP